MVTPVGHLSVWQAWAWMQPRANMKPRAELAQSAPSAMTRAISKAEVILALQPMRPSPRMLMPTRALCTNINPSRKGMPM